MSYDEDETANRPLCGVYHNSVNYTCSGKCKRYTPHVATSHLCDTCSKEF